MTKKVLRESSDSAVKEAIMEAIEQIKAAKRAQLAEEQGDRDENNIAADNSKIEAGKGDYHDDAKHIGDSTQEWVYEEDESKDDLDDADKDDDKNDDDKSEESDDDKAIKEMSAKISQHMNSLSEEESVESAIAPEIDGVGAGVAKVEDAGEQGDADSTDHKMGPSIEQGSDSKEVKHVAEEKRDTDNVSADNSKIDSGKGKYSNSKALEHAKEANPEDMAEQFVTKEDFDLSEDMQAILGSSEALSEEFKTRVETIFGAAVVAKANQVIAEALEIVKEDMNSYRASLNEKYETQIDKYLNVIVEEWATENKQVLVENTRYDLSQSLLEGVKNLFENHYLDMPKAKLDVFDKLVEENIALEDQVNQLISEKVENASQLKGVKKAQILGEAVSGLSMSQAEKVKVLAESIDYVTDVDFKVKLNEIKSAYFSKPVKTRSIEQDYTPVQLNESKAAEMDDEVAGAVEFLSRKI